VIVVSRFSVSEAEGDAFSTRAEAALAALAACAGYQRGRVGRSVDDPTRWILVTEWDGVGAYRRALSAYQVRMTAAPLLAESIDEPGAYEVLIGDEGTRPSDRANG
jgi:quinol monooxygenase YgiN